MTTTSTDRRQGVNSSAAVKVPCRAASTAALTRSGEQTVDGVALVTGDRVLVKDQSSGVENGVYVVDTGDWTRAKDFDGSYDARRGTVVFVHSGTTNQGWWYVSTPDPITIGTTAIALTRSSTTLAVISPYTQTLLDDTTEYEARATLGLDVPGIDYTGATDSLAALQAYIDAQGANTIIRLGVGTIKLTGTLNLSNNRVHLIGAGKWATQILFAPTSNDTCIEVSNGVSVVYQGSIRGMTIYSDDSTYTKVGIDLVDMSEYVLEDVIVHGSVIHGGGTFWSGGTGSIGIRTKGREALHCNRVSSFAQKPLQISENPNASIDADHFHFENMYLIGYNNPIVTIDTGVNLTQCTFDGYQIWARGTHGLYWVDTTTSGSSNGLHLKNVRREQAENATDWLVDIEHNTSLQNLKLDSCYGPGSGRGIKLRNVSGVTLEQHQHSSATLALDIDSTVTRVEWVNCLWQASSTVSMPDHRIVFGMPKNPSTGALPPSGYAVLTSDTSRQMILGGAVAEDTITLANDGVYALGASGLAGLLVVVDSEGRTGTFVCKGTNDAVTESIDVDTVYSHTKDNASTTNVYYDSGYKLQNKRGGERRYKVLLIGSYGTF